MEEDLKSKQHYLRAEIIDEGYDPSDFNNYMCSIRQEEAIDLDSWSLQDIKDVVASYKEALKNKEKQEQEEQVNQENEIQNDGEQETNINYIIENNQNINNTNEYASKPKEINSDISRNTINNLESQINAQGNNAFDDYNKIIPCTKLDNNQLTYREDLYITITQPVKINPGFFSISYYQYAVKTYPLNFDVARKVSDFTFLNQKLPLIHPVVYTPALPNFTYGLKDDSPKKMLYIQNYMNLLIENRFFRTLPIIYDFLTLPQEDWNKKVKSNYSKIKEPTGFDTMPNFEGKYLIRITEKDEVKASKIKAEINSKNDALNNLNSHLDELLAAMEKVSNCFKSVATSFQDLSKRNINNKVLNKGYDSLFNLFKTWSDDYLSQKKFIRDEIKYYFKFVNKEYNTFLKNYENYRLGRDSYKNTFNRMKKNKNPTKDDLFMLQDIRNYYGFELIHINSEYEKLEERMGKRLKKQFVKYYENRDIIFQDYQKCCDLLKFQTNCFNEKINKLENYINQYEEELNQNNQNIMNENSQNKENNYNEIIEGQNKDEINNDTGDNNNDIKDNNINIIEENKNINKEESKTMDNNENKIIKENKNENIINDNIKIDNNIKEDKKETNINENEKININENKEENMKEEKKTENNKEKKEEKKKEIREEIKIVDKKEENKGEIKEEIKIEEKKQEIKEKENKEEIKEEIKIEEKKEEEKKEEEKKEEIKIEEKKVEIKDEKKEEIKIEIKEEIKEGEKNIKE